MFYKFFDKKFSGIGAATLTDTANGANIILNQQLSD